MAWQRARASNGARTWDEELYGSRCPFVTPLLARITYELMLEQERQEMISLKRAEEKFFNADAALMHDPMYPWMRGKRIEVRY